MTHKYYKWTAQEDFDAWHQTVIIGLGLPKIGHNQSTGELDPQATQTTAYTQVKKIQHMDFRAMVEDEIAEIYSDGLGEIIEMQPPFPSWTPTGEFGKYEASIPKPNDGKEYYWDDPSLSWIEVD